MTSVLEFAPIFGQYRPERGGWFFLNFHVRDCPTLGFNYGDARQRGDVACAQDFMGLRCVMALRVNSPGRAIAQLVFSAAHWALVGGVMYLLLDEWLPYGTTLAVLMAASVVGVVTPIPAELGVLEAVYLTLLSGQLGNGTVMGAVLAYRALYYLLPLVGGLGCI